jgi:1-pyrroline-5-carboxylate dehydrogenase
MWVIQLSSLSLHKNFLFIMSNAIFRVPKAVNEPVKAYALGSSERMMLKAAIAELKAMQVDIPMFIDGKEVRTGKTVAIHPPHELSHTLGHYHQGDAGHVKMAIDAALKAKAQWENTSWEERAAIFLKAADLLTGPYRYKMNAATMLGQSKNAFQAEIDSACELIDFWRFNVEFMTQVYSDQPESLPGMWNRMEHRALEGFVFALSPFNFTSIGGNLPTAPAMMGNTVVWKTSNTQIYSAWVIMEILREAGLT